MLEFSPSTISRELQRNTTAAGEYDPERAPELTDERRSPALSSGRVSDEIIAPQLRNIMEHGWRPAQAARQEDLCLNITPEWQPEEDIR